MNNSYSHDTAGNLLKNGAGIGRVFALGEAEAIVKMSQNHEAMTKAICEARIILTEANPNCSPEYLFGQISKAFTKLDAVANN